MTYTHPTTAQPEHAMQAQTRVDDARDLDKVLRYTGGEYPVSGDQSRKVYTLWPRFKHRNLWGQNGVRA